MIRKLFASLLLLAACALGQTASGGTASGGQFALVLANQAALLPDPSADFGQVFLGNTGVQFVTYFNSGTVNVTLSSISGPSNAAFSQSNNCGALPVTLAPSQSCQFTLMFTPSAAVTYSDSITLTDNAFGSPRKIFLNGSGLGSVHSSATPASIIFPNTVVGIQSAIVDITYLNDGQSAVNYGGATVGTARFAVDDSSCPALLSVGTSCVIHVTFTPNAASTFNDTVTIVDDASNPTVSLTGTGISTPNPQVVLNNSGSVGFASHRYWQFITNTAVLAGSGLGTNPPTGNQTSIAELVWLDATGAAISPSTVLSVDSSPTCGGLHPGSLAADGNSGTYWVTEWSTTCNPAAPLPQPHNIKFDFGSAKSVTGLLLTVRQDGCDNGWPLNTIVKFSDDNSTYTQFDTPQFSYAKDTLGCPGASTPSPKLFQTGAPVSFPTTAVNTTSSGVAIPLVNTGNGALTISSITASTGFTQTNNCGGSLGAGLGCTITAKFAPTTAGMKTGTITVSDNAGGGTQVVSLNGVAFVPVTVSSLSVTLPQSSMVVGTTQQGSAKLVFSDGTTADVTSCATWASSNTADATVSASGLVTAIASTGAGSINITATDSVLSGNCQKSGKSGLSSLQVTPVANVGAISNTFFAMGLGTPGTVNNYANEGFTPGIESNIFGGGRNVVGMVRTWDCFVPGVGSQANICRWDKMNSSSGVYDFSPFDATGKAEWLTYAGDRGIEIDLVFGNTPSWVGLANSNTGCKYGSSCSSPADVLNTTTACTIKDATGNPVSIPNLTNGNCAYKQSAYDFLTRKTSNGRFLFCQKGQAANDHCINNVEIVNEWNSCPVQDTLFTGNCTGFNTSQQDVQALLVESYDFYQIKQFVNPSIMVIASGPQGYGSGSPTSTQHVSIKSEVSAWPNVAGRSFSSGLGPYVDVFSFHSYTVNPPELVYNQVNDIKNILGAVQCGGSACSNKPLWQLEFYPSSWDSTTSGSLGNCSTDEDFVMRYYIASYGAGLGRTAFYQYDHGPITSGGMVAFGSTNHVAVCGKDSQNAVTHAGTAFAQLMNWMVGAKAPSGLTCALSPNQTVNGCGHLTDIGGSTPATGVFTMNLTRASAGGGSANWTQAQIVYDTTGNSCYVPPAYAGHFWDSQATNTAITTCGGHSGQVQIGSRPILLVP